MVRPIGWKEIAARIQDFVAKPDPVLFAGAGVASRAGLPSWPEFIEYLATMAEKYEPDISVLIRARAKDNRYPEASHFFKQCQMPEGEKYAALAQQFHASKYDARSLKPLVSIPWLALVTTNYDRSLLDAWSDVYRRAPAVAELGDPSLLAATHATEAFIARIHGRAELPATMVVDTDDYARVRADNDYIEFLSYILRRRRCMFVGFSFLDPAISSVLEVGRHYLTLGVQAAHMALVPASAHELAARLAQYNIEVVLFEARDPDPYADLWGAVSEVARSIGVTGMRPRPTPIFPTALESARHLLASCYVRAKLLSHLQPLRHLVFQGIIVALAAEAGEEGVDRADLPVALQRLLPLTVSEIEQIVDEPVAALIASQTCHEVGTRLVCGPVENRLDQDMDVLVDGALNRLNLRRGGRTRELATEEHAARQVIGQALQEALLERGWDLGAEFAGSATRRQVDCWTILEDVVSRRAPDMALSVRVDIVASCVDLLRRPTDREARILADVGRLAFGIDVILQHGRSTLLHARALPDRLYLDASVAMPAIVNGHPLRPVYVDALDRWRQALLATGLEPRLMLGDVFLDEILSHRQRALKIVKNEELEDPERLRKHLLFRGAQYTNVFIGAYGTWVGREPKGPVPFGAWLGQQAPYTSAEELTRYLLQQGIETTRLRLSREEEEVHRQIRAALETAYDEDETSSYNPKPEVLIRDEAYQLTRLKTDLDADRRVLFVSADNRLRRLAVGPVLGYVGAAIVSHIALVQLIDLLVGVEAEPRSLARLLWGVQYVDDRMALRNYFVDLALQRHEEAMVMSLPLILEAVVDRSAREAKRDGLHFWGSDPQDQARVAKFLDRVEDQFFDAMTEAVAKFRDHSGQQ